MKEVIQAESQDLPFPGPEVSTSLFHPEKEDFWQSG